LRQRGAASQQRGKCRKSECSFHLSSPPFRFFPRRSASLLVHTPR
jgi:hypothetical protein